MLQVLTVEVLGKLANRYKGLKVRIEGLIDTIQDHFVGIYEGYTEHD